MMSLSRRRTKGQSIAQRVSSTLSTKLSSLSLRGSVMFRIGKGGFKVPRYQNTYRLEPFNPYKCEVVDKILQEVMENHLKNVTYPNADCVKLSLDITGDIRNKIFKKSYDRYKYIVWITIIQKLGQSIHVDLGCLWDFDRDTYSTYIFESTTFVAVGIVAATYYE